MIKTILTISIATNIAMLYLLWNAYIEIAEYESQNEEEQYERIRKISRGKNKNKK